MYTCKNERIQTFVCLTPSSCNSYCLQKCIGFILACIEAHAEHGFLCTIGENEMRLYPRLGAMALDTIERVKYFGLRNVAACGICRKRCGRSITRKATCHDPAYIAAQYVTANATSRLGGRRKVQYYVCIRDIMHVYSMRVYVLECTYTNIFICARAAST